MTVATTTSFYAPTEGMLTSVTNPQSGEEGYAYPLQTAAWVKMQKVVQQALAFPLTTQDFTDSYGAFSDEGEVTAALQVLSQIHTTANKYGDPLTLISDIKQFEEATSPPPHVYGHAVWLATQTETTAQQIVSLLNQGLTDIGQVSKPADRLQDLTELLTGKGQINDQATALKALIETFSGQVSNFYNELNPELTGKTNSLASYLAQSDSILQVAQQDVTNEQAAIDQVNKTISKLNEEYIGFTVAASLSPLFLLVPFFGPLLAIADAATFAALAVETKKALTAAESTLSVDKKDKQQKAALVTQLQGFNGESLKVETDGTAFLATIATMIGGWSDFTAQINKRLASLTVADVTDWPAFLQQTNFQAAVSQWKTIASTAETFRTAGFATFSPSTSS